MKDSGPWEVESKCNELYRCLHPLTWDRLQDMTPGGGNQVETSRVPELRQQSCDSGESEAARVGRAGDSGEDYIDQFRRSVESPLECSAECWSAYTCDLPISPFLRKSMLLVSYTSFQRSSMHMYFLLQMLWYTVFWTLVFVTYKYSLETVPYL